MIEVWATERTVDDKVVVTFLANTYPPTTVEWELTEYEDKVGPFYGRAPAGRQVFLEIWWPREKTVALQFHVKGKRAIPASVRWTRAGEGIVEK